MLATSMFTTLIAESPAEATPSGFDAGNCRGTIVRFAGWAARASNAPLGAELEIDGLLSVPQPKVIANLDPPLLPAAEDVQHWTGYGSLATDWWP